MTEQDEALKRLAEAATPGPWTADDGHESGLARRYKEAETMMYSINGPAGVSDYEDWGYTKPNAEYMAAASPDVVRDLLARLEAAERDAGRYRLIERKACATGSAGQYQFHVINLPNPVSDPMRGNVGEHFGAALDAEIARKKP